MLGITQLVAADYHGKVPVERLLAFDDGDDLPDFDGDGVDDLNDKCPNLPGDAAHCGCPENLVIVVAGNCIFVNDPDDPNNMNDSEGVPVGGGLLLLLASALAYGLTLKQRNKNFKFEEQ
ncbi:MAG: hypothetical protein FWF72_01570 [Paludibacter sp.]|nr:hypothetical protein [Paludibacter sp.]